MVSEQPAGGTVLTPAQTLMWIEGQLHPEVPVNNMVTRLDIKAALDVGVFKQAFARLVAGHDAMRMVVSNSGGRFVAAFTETPLADLAFVDFSGEAAAGRALDAWIQRACRRVFGLDEQLYEAALIKLCEQDFVFFMNQHHCVTDGRSCQVMLAELDRFYREATDSGCRDEAGETAPSRSFGEYLAKRSDYLCSEQARVSEAYWSRRFESAPEPLRFYGHGTERKGVSTRRHTRMLPAVLCQQILGGKQEVAPSLVFATTLFAFLKRVTGNSDLCIGVPLLNRTPEFGDTLGMFMEISRNRLNVSSEDSFSSLLEKIRAEANSIKPHRSHTVTSRNARFECMLNYRVPSDTCFGGEPADLQRIAPIALLDCVPGAEDTTIDWTGRTSIDVDVTHTPASGEFCLAMDFNTGVWADPAARERSLDHFIRVLELFFEDRGALIDRLELTGAAERRLLESWNDTGREFAPHTGIQQLFEEQVERTPDAIALEFSDQLLSYRELNCRANRLAHALIAHGVQVEQRVGVCLKRSPELVVALLAVLKAGAGYVPLDLALPQQRRELIAADAGLERIISELTLGELLRGADFADSNPQLALAPSRLAYVIYTSGTTGRPKGVMIEHAALVNFIHAAQEVLQLREHHRLLSVTTSSFDIFALEMFAPLVCGARMVLASDETVVDGRLLAREINERGVTHLQGTPATWHLLLDAGWQPAQALVGVVGGELLTTNLAERVASRCAQFINAYGPTETTVYMSHTVVRAGAYQAGDIGRPLANCRIHVLDAWRKPVPIGVTGEIYIGGDCLARGYLGRDDLTAAAFIETAEFGRLYRSGDLGRWTAGGYIEFLGRSDFQVKVRGYRIELGEIEAALLSHPAVNEAVVTVIGEAENKQLAAYVRLQPLSDPAAQPGAMLREHLKQSLPKYMIPATVSVLQRLPLTPSGKVDRKALPAPAPDIGSAADSCLAPETPAQQTVAKIWCEALGLERVGIRDDFFDLGGHSLAAMSVVTRVEEATGIRLDLADFFQGLTIEDICRTVGAAQTGSAHTVQSALFMIDGGRSDMDLTRPIQPGQTICRLQVHALQRARLGRGLQPLSGVEEMAAELIGIICATQCSGPYRIAADRDGALIAFALALDLRRRGEQVAQLILCNPRDAVAARGNGLFARMGRQFKAFRRDLQMATGLREIIRNQYVEYGISRALVAYRPCDRFDGQITLAYSSGSTELRVGDRTRGWSRYASLGVQVDEIRGERDRWLLEAAAVLAKFADPVAPPVQDNRLE